MGIIFEQAEMSDMSGSKNRYFIFMLSWIVGETIFFSVENSTMQK